jgi:hypothetical protein
MNTGTPPTMYNIMYKSIYIKDIYLCTHACMNVYPCWGGRRCTQGGMPGTDKRQPPGRLSDVSGKRSRPTDNKSSAHSGRHMGRIGL